MIRGVSASRLAKFDRSSNQWTAMSTNGDVNDLLYYSGRLYVGGSFTSPTNSIAYHNGASFVALTSGISGTVKAMMMWNSSTLIVGGQFVTAGGVTVNNIAQFNTISNTWSSLANGTVGDVRAFGKFRSELIVVGNFSRIGNVATRGIAKWNFLIQQWTPLASSVDNWISSIATTGNALVVSGAFINIEGKNTSRIAMINPDYVAIAPTPIPTPQPTPTPMTTMIPIFDGNVQTSSNVTAGFLSNSGALIGVVVGVVLFCLLICAIVVVCVVRYRKRNSREVHDLPMSPSK